jgi:phosphopantothenate synthetase
MRQVGFWKGFVSALVVIVGLYAVNASARQGGVQYIDQNIRMADAMVAIAQELREMNDKGLKVRVETEKPLKIDKLEMSVPNGLEIKPSTRPIEVNVKSTQ